MEKEHLRWHKIRERLNNGFEITKKGFKEPGDSVWFIECQGLTTMVDQQLWEDGYRVTDNGILVTQYVNKYTGLDLH